MGAKVDYIHREGCHLCDDYLPQLIQFTNKYKIQFTQKDVDTDFALYELYNVEVPAVVLDGNIINQFFFNEDELLQALKLTNC